MRSIRGAPGSGKTALVFREFSEAIRNGRRDVRIVVPTATLVRHYQHELARSGLVFNPKCVVSLSRFALDCAPGMRLAPPDLLRALVRGALARLQLPEFAEAASTRGMADIVLETITLFENADCTPDRLAKARGLSPHGKAFLKVWRDAEAAIELRGFATRAQIIRRAALNIAENIPVGTVWMDGFLKFSPLEAELVGALAAKGELTLALTNSPVTDDARLLALELGASEQLLPGAARSPHTIAVKAPTPEREADEIARRILSLHAEGAEFSGVAVALRDVENWLPLLRSVFDRFGVPARYYFSTPARMHPVAVFLSGLISSALANWDFSSALSAFHAHPAWGHSAEFDRFDFRVREAMPGHGGEALSSLCEGERLRAQIGDCLKISSWLGTPLRPALWQQRFGQLAERLYRPGTIPAPEDYAEVETARSHAAGLRAWAAALDTAAQSWPPGQGPVSLEQFHAVVRDALEAASMQIPDDRRNIVHVMSVFEARQWEVKTLFVCGMTARDYPRRHSRNLLFPDSDIERLRASGIRLRTAAEEDRDEELLFDSLKTRASESLVLTASARDSGGQTIVPSLRFSEASEVSEAAEIQHSFACRPSLTKPAAESGIDGRIGEALLAGLAEQHRIVSLTALEDLAKCRFRFFAGRSLGLKAEPDKPADRLQPRTTGLIFHEAMEAWLPDRTRDFVHIFEDAFDEACRKRNIPRGYRLEVERVQLRRIAREVNEHAQWPVTSSEAEVDCSLDFPGGVTVKCRVDRIDRIGGNDCVIVDYKSGKTENVGKLVESETSLQGPLYALAVREKKQLNPIAMVFLAIREGAAMGWGDIPGTDLDLAAMPPDWIDNARDRTIARLADFLSGDVHAEPTHRDNCQWCDFADICRIEQVALVQIEAAGGN